MKKNRILAILWLAFCCYACFNELRAVLALHPTAGLWPAWCFFASLCLLYLAGIVASLFLFRGAIWPRWILALIAIFVVLGNIGYIMSYRSLPVWAASLCVFVLVSLVLLFLPKHEPVAKSGLLEDCPPASHTN
jgi:hypothetical protein